MAALFTEASPIEAPRQSTRRAACPAAASLGRCAALPPRGLPRAPRCQQAPPGRGSSRLPQREPPSAWQRRNACGRTRGSSAVPTLRPGPRGAPSPAPQFGEPGYSRGLVPTWPPPSQPTCLCPLLYTCIPVRPRAGLRSASAGTPRRGTGQRRAEGRLAARALPGTCSSSPGTPETSRRLGLRARQRHRLPCGDAGHLLRLSRESAEKARLGGQATALRAACAGGTAAVRYVSPRLPHKEASARNAGADPRGLARADNQARPQVTAEQPHPSHGPPPPRRREEEEEPGGRGRQGAAGPGRRQGRGPIKGPAHG